MPDAGCPAGRRFGDHDLDVTVYPDPYEDAIVLVDIPFERLASNLYKPVRYDGNAVPLKVVAG